MASECQEGPTAVDYIHAIAYAHQQISKMKCVDPEVIKSVCESAPTGQYSGGGTCIQWQEDASQAMFPIPQNYYVNSCRSDSECYMGKCKDGYCQCNTDSDCPGDLTCKTDIDNPSITVCAYAPDNVAAGHCIFNNETACKAQGQLPYTCDCGPTGNNVGSCTTRDKKDLKFPYTEWRVDEKTGKGQCVLGNFILRQWCEKPCTRCKKDETTGKYPPECTAGEYSRGVTDVPPFFYDENKGACYMTHNYCDWYNMDYNMDSCDPDDPNSCPGDNNHCDGAPENPHCTGPDAKCYENTGDKIGQFFLGKTLFYMLKKGKTCNAIHGGESHEHYQGPGQDSELKRIQEEIAETLNNTPQMACSLHDPKKIKRRKTVKRDFGGPGIHLYLFDMGNDKLKTGFDPDEVKTRYPDNVEKHYDGTTYICVDRDDLTMEDRFLKRIYLAINSSTWMTESILWAVENFMKRTKK